MSNILFSLYNSDQSGSDNVKYKNFLNKFTGDP